ncbi:hypothetical protein BLOT_015439 [Blomia tropicalis]|nr:hypothetical protein BLOT_015439 [Blomia tropicalis]
MCCNLYSNNRKCFDLKAKPPPPPTPPPPKSSINTFYYCIDIERIVQFHILGKYMNKPLYS